MNREAWMVLACCVSLTVATFVNYAASERLAQKVRNLEWLVQRGAVRQRDADGLLEKYRRANDLVLLVTLVVALTATMWWCLGPDGQLTGLDVLTIGVIGAVMFVIHND